MKSSNLLLGAWLFVVAAITFAAAYFLLKGDEPGPSGGDPVALNGEDGAPGDGDPDDGVTRGGGRDPVRPNTVRPKRISPRIRGRVVDSTGAGVGGADVAVARPVEVPPAEETVRTKDLHKIYALLVLENEEFDLPRPMEDFQDNLQRRAAAVAGGAVELARVTTTPDGRFDIEVPRHAGTGPFRLTARKDGVGKASAQGVQQGADIELTLGQPMQVRGIVMAGDASVGVPGAFVVLNDGETRFSTRTDDKGEFRIEGMAPGKYSADAAATGHPPMIDSRVEVTTGARLELRMPRGATLRVVATLEDDTGERPLPDCEVVAMEMSTYAYVTGSTNGNGVIEFPGLPPGQYLVNGRHPTAIPFAEELVPIPPNELLVEQVLEFEPAVQKPIEVVDPSGNPLPGVVFYSANVDEEYDALRSEKLPGQTDARGIYNFAFQFDGTRALIYGFKKGYAIIRVYPEEYDTPDTHHVVALPAVRVFGSVRTPAGVPVPDALVILECMPAEDYDADDEGEYLLNIRSGPDGSFDFPNMPRGDILVSAELGDDGWSDEVEIEMIEGQIEYRADLEMELE